MKNGHYSAESTWQSYSYIMIQRDRPLFGLSDEKQLYWKNLLVVHTLYWMVFSKSDNHACSSLDLEMHKGQWQLLSLTYLWSLKLTLKCFFICTHMYIFRQIHRSHDRRTKLWEKWGRKQYSWEKILQYFFSFFDVRFRRKLILSNNYRCTWKSLNTLCHTHMHAHTHKIKCTPTSCVCTDTLVAPTNQFWKQQ